MDRHIPAAHRRQQPHLGRAQLAPRAQHRLALADVGPHGADPLPRGGGARGREDPDCGVCVVGVRFGLVSEL